ncbi:MAG TPA: NUDIX domain-containing protein [Candidatus Limnocylindrales bacterium]
MGSRVSAGILLHRRRDGRVEVLLGHPGGPLFARRDAGHWSIPKGEVEQDEALEAVARREFAEETGVPVPDGPLLPLGTIRQKGGKLVHGWAGEGDLDPARARSNTFLMEWPPGSGARCEFPELDRVAWFDLDEARRRLKETQLPFLDRLAAALGAPTPTGHREVGPDEP